MKINNKYARGTELAELALLMGVLIMPLLFITLYCGLYIDRSISANNICETVSMAVKRRCEPLPVETVTSCMQTILKNMKSLVDLKHGSSEFEIAISRFDGNQANDLVLTSTGSALSKYDRSLITGPVADAALDDLFSSKSRLFIVEVISRRIVGSAVVNLGVYGNAIFT